jgi:GPH family glycoside/pentoside/hexuronide:cation symporter
MKQNASHVRPFGMADKIGYMFGDFGNDFTFILSSMFMMKFYTDVMGIQAGIVGLLMMTARFVDAFTDVTMGQIVDRSKPTADGKFLPWIKRMCGPVAIASFLIYQSSLAGMPMGVKVTWMFVTYILWGSIFYTSINIPYGSMASAVSPEADDRASLSTFRTIGATLASMVIGVGTPMVAYTVVDGATVLSGSRMTIIAGVFSILAVICYILCFKLVRERVEIPQNTTKLDLVAMFKSIFKNRALLGIIAAAILLLLGMLGMTGMQPYIFPVYYNNGGAQSLASFTSNLAVLVVCAPLAVKLSSKFGKKELATVSCLCAAVTWIVCLILRPENAMVFVAFYTVAMVGIGFFNTIIWAMITDVIDDAEVKNGVREDGTIYSVYSFARKMGQAISSGMIGGILTMIGYSDAVAKNPSAYPEVMSGIFNWSCLIPAIGLVLVALALIFIYPLSKKKVDSNVAELASRRK